MNGWLVAAILAALVAAFAAGIGAGVSWDRGVQARATLVATTAERDAARKDLADYHAQLQAASAQFQRDAGQLRSIAEDYANGRNEQTRFYAAHNAKLERFLAGRPDLAACDIGPVGLGLWNAANRGADENPAAPGSGAATVADRPEPAGRVSGPAAGVIWPIARPAAQPRSGDGAVSRLPTSPSRIVPRGEGARGAGSGKAAARAGSERALIKAGAR